MHLNHYFASSYLCDACAPNISFAFGAENNVDLPFPFDDNHARTSTYDMFALKGKKMHKKKVANAFKVSNSESNLIATIFDSKPNRSVTFGRLWPWRRPNRVWLLSTKIVIRRNEAKRRSEREEEGRNVSIRLLKAKNICFNCRIALDSLRKHFFIAHASHSFFFFFGHSRKCEKVCGDVAIDLKHENSTLSTHESRSLFLIRKCRHFRKNVCDFDFSGVCRTDPNLNSKTRLTAQSVVHGLRRSLDYHYPLSSSPDDFEIRKRKKRKKM